MHARSEGIFSWTRSVVWWKTWCWLTIERRFTYEPPQCQSIRPPGIFSSGSYFRRPVPLTHFNSCIPATNNFNSWGNKELLLLLWGNWLKRDLGTMVWKSFPRGDERPTSVCDQVFNSQQPKVCFCWQCSGESEAFVFEYLLCYLMISHDSPSWRNDRENAERNGQRRGHLSFLSTDKFHNSRAASPENLHHAVWRTWLFTAYSSERWLYYQFSLTHLCTTLKKRLGEWTSYTEICIRNFHLTLSLPRVINVKFLLQPHQKYKSHSMKNLAIHSLLRWNMITANLTNLYISFKRRRKMYILNFGVKGLIV